MGGKRERLPYKRMFGCRAGISACRERNEWQAKALALQLFGFRFQSGARFSFLISTFLLRFPAVEFRPRSQRSVRLRRITGQFSTFYFKLSNFRVNTLRAFTLVELLVVMSIISVLMVLVAPAFTNRKSADDMTKAADGIKGLLETARTYARANNTYTFVGFAEVDASVDSSVSPQVAGNGRVAVAAVISKDGSRQFQYVISGQGSDWTANYSNGAHLLAVGNLQTYEGLHFLVDFGSWTPAAHPTSKMARYQPSNPTYTLGNAGSSSVTPFTWPLGSSLGSGQYQFNKVIYFDPQGVARIATSTNADYVANVMEIDFQQSHGTVIPPFPANQDVGNNVVIQIDPSSGAIRVYRP
jgi:prepilin-type N-terminal cleavage/methylation domain-containing protein